ncbi:hypothetical protein WMF30_38610 [Sorangium sp. So ce134]
MNETYGAEAVSLYGSSEDEEHGTCFIIAGIGATFSVLTLEGALPDGHYDVQVESIPPGDYVYATEVDLDGFMRLVAQIAGPPDTWPV